MADTVVSDAARFPQDEGYPNIADGNETWDSAGHLGLLSIGTANGKFIYDGLTFTAHDATNDTVDVSAGVAVLDMSEDGSVSVQSGTGGSSAPSYDTTLSRAGAIVVECPTATTLSMTDTALNPVWIAYATDGTLTGVAAGDVYYRHGSAETAPPHPSIKIGETNPDDSTADFRSGFDNPPDKGGWREDPNSPFTITVNSGDLTMNLAGRYDEIRVEGVCWTDRAQSGGFDIYINGDTTANYVTVADGSSVSSGLSNWGTFARLRASPDDVEGTVAASYEYTLIADWPDGATADGPSINTVQQPVQRSGGALSTWESGYFDAAMTPPITSITHTQSNDVGQEVEVYGRKTPNRPNI